MGEAATSVPAPPPHSLDPESLPASQVLRRAPLPVLGRLIEPLYRAEVSRRNALFDRGRGVHAFPVPVISIGNLSVGGTGKTPLVMHTLRVLLEAKRRPCVAMRGYGRRGEEEPDEVDAYRREFPTVEVVAQPDRTAGLKSLLGGATAREAAAEHRTTRTPDCIVLDDGFQHRQIARDVDVVLIDASPGRSVFADRCLPAGWLREPVESLGRASMVVLTHAELASRGEIDRLREEVSRRTGAPIAVTRHVWTALRQRVDGEERMLPLDALIGKRVVGCCAIGHPEAFLASLERMVGEAGDVGWLVYPDHDPLGPKRVRAIGAMARAGTSEFIVVTDKDWSKLRRVPETQWPCPVVRPELAVVFDSGREEFERLVLGAVGKAGRRT